MAAAAEKNLQVHFGNPTSRNFKLDDYPFYLIDKVNTLYGLEMETVLRKHNMERVQWQLLLILREKNPSSISELAERSGKKLSTVSRTIERMRRDNMISTAPRDSDNRVTDVYLQKTGVDSLKKILSVASKQYERAMQGYGEAEIRSLHEQLKNIYDNLTRSPFE